MKLGTKDSFSTSECRIISKAIKKTLAKNRLSNSNNLRKTLDGIEKDVTTI